MKLFVCTPKSVLIVSTTFFVFDSLRYKGRGELYSGNDNQTWIIGYIERISTNMLRTNVTF